MHMSPSSATYTLDTCMLKILNSFNLKREHDVPVFLCLGLVIPQEISHFSVHKKVQNH